MNISIRPIEIAERAFDPAALGHEDKPLLVGEGKLLAGNSQPQLEWHIEAWCLDSRQIM